MVSIPHREGEGSDARELFANGNKALEQMQRDRLGGDQRGGGAINVMALEEPASRAGAGGDDWAQREVNTMSSALQMGRQFEARQRERERVFSRQLLAQEAAQA